MSLIEYNLCAVLLCCTVMGEGGRLGGRLQVRRSLFARVWNATTVCLSATPTQFLAFGSTSISMCGFAHHTAARLRDGIRYMVINYLIGCLHWVPLVQGTCWIAYAIDP